MGRQVASRTAGRFIASLLQAGTLVLIARDIGPHALAQFASSIAVGVLLCAVLGMGLPMLALRIQVIGSEARLSLPFYVAIGIRLGIVAALVATGGLILNLPPVVVAAVSTGIFVDGMNDAQQSLLAGYERHVQAAVLMIGRRLCVLLTTTVGVLVSPGSALLAYTGGMAITLCLPLLHAASVRSFSRADVALLARKARGYWGTAVLSAVWPVDVAIVTSLAGSAQGGSYAGASRITGPLNLAITSLLAVGTPRLARATSENERRHLTNRLFRASWALAGAIVAISPLLAWLGSTMLGQDFEGISHVIVLMCLVMALSGVSQISLAEALAAGRSLAIARATFLAVSCGLAAVAVLALLGDGRWAALGGLVSQSLFLVWMKWERNR